MRNHRFNGLAHFVAGLVVVGVLCGGFQPVRAQLPPGTILVVDHFGGQSQIGALFAVDPITGDREMISDYGNPAQGLPGEFPQYPNALLYTTDGTILVTNTGGDTLDRGGLYSVNPADGMRQRITDFGNATQGLPLGQSPVGVLIANDNTLLVVDQDSGMSVGFSNLPGALFRVNPLTGQRTVLSDFGNPSQGPLGQDPRNLAQLSDETILVIDFLARTDPSVDIGGILFAVNPITGERTIISAFGDADQGPTMVGPLDVAVTENDKIYVVADGGAGTSPGALFTVDVTTGQREIVSDFNNANQGPTGREPIGVAIMADGTILVTDSLEKVLFKVNPANGMRTVFSNFRDGTQGDIGFDPRGITVVPGAPDGEGPVTTNVVATPNPVAVNIPITLTATVDDTDTGGSTIDAADYFIDGGNLVVMDAQDGAFDEVSEVVTATIPAFTEAGVHEVCVVGTDAVGNVGVEDCIMFAVYDPTAGFVTGGGFINSQAGACQSDLCIDTTGKAIFGFVSKYHQGASIPTGKTDFKFKAGDLDFHSEVYDWLVVNQGGTNAQFKGAGTVNGAPAPSGGPFKFMIWARDLEPTGDDTFQIKIWYEDGGSEIVVYDNGVQAIDGGNIKIHSN
jgi:hypothetical protein